MQELEQYLDDPPAGDAPVNRVDEEPKPSLSTDGSGVDLYALTKKIYALFKAELRLERERGGPYQRWR